MYLYILYVLQNILKKILFECVYSKSALAQCVWTGFKSFLLKLVETVIKVFVIVLIYFKNCIRNSFL